MTELKLKSDLSEIVPYNYLYLPVHVRKCALSDYPGMGFVSHWHGDLEFVVVLNGRMRYLVNGEERILSSGDGIFVNSRQMHRAESVDRADCAFLCVVFPPTLLCATTEMENACVRPLLENIRRPFSVLEPLPGRGGEILECLGRLHVLCATQEPGFELGVMSAVYSLGFLLRRFADHNSGESTVSIDRRIAPLREMIGFVQKNYRDRITLGDIAHAGSVSRSCCCDLFRSILRISPIAYLTNYRVEKSMELLSDRALSVTEIAAQSGFGSPSYYAETFRSLTGKTPSEYRRHSAHGSISAQMGARRRRAAL